LKFGTLKGRIRVHPDTKFVCNGYKFINDYSRKITPICCHAYRVNCYLKEVGNCQGDRVTIEPQTFCYLKEIELKITKIQKPNSESHLEKIFGILLLSSGDKFSEDGEKVVWSCVLGEDVTHEVGIII